MTPAVREIIRLPFRTEEKASQNGAFKRKEVPRCVIWVRDPLGRSNPRALPVTASLPGSFKKDRSRRYRPRREGDRQLMSPPVVRQFVPAQRVLRFTSPRPKPPHGKARAGMLYPNR